MRKRVYAPYRSRSISRTKKATKKDKFSFPLRSALSSASRPSPLTGPGSMLKAKLIYCETGVVLNPGLGATAVYVFNLGNLFDPNVTGVGHQPTGFDQLMAIYEQYQVINCISKVTYDNINTAGSSGLVCGLTVTDVVTTNIDPRVYIENGSTVHKTISARGDGMQIGMLSTSTNLATAHGLTAAQYSGDDVYKGNASGGPAEGLFLHVWVADIGGGDPSGANILVELEMDCVFTGSKLNTLS